MATQSRGVLRALTVVFIVLTICVYAVLGVSTYTLARSISSSLMGITMQEGDLLPFGINTTIDAVGNMVISFIFTVRNPGLLEIKVTLNMRILSVDGEVIAEDTGEIRVRPGLESKLPLSLTIQPKFVNLHELRGVVSIKYRTLFDLIGTKVSIDMGGGE